MGQSELSLCYFSGTVKETWISVSVELIWDFDRCYAALINFQSDAERVWKSSISLSLYGSAYIFPLGLQSRVAIKA